MSPLLSLTVPDRTLNPKPFTDRLEHGPWADPTFGIMENQMGKKMENEMETGVI